MDASSLSLVLSATTIAFAVAVKIVVAKDVHLEADILHWIKLKIDIIR